MNDLEGRVPCTNVVLAQLLIMLPLANRSPIFAKHILGGLLVKKPRRSGAK